MLAVLQIIDNKLPANDGIACFPFPVGDFVLFSSSLCALTVLGSNHPHAQWDLWSSSLRRIPLAVFNAEGWNMSRLASKP
jgi:hypothetical protein